MPPEYRDDAAYLHDMARYGRIVLDLCKGRSRPDTDLVFRLAVERALHNLCEAARKVSRAFEAEHPEINWKGIVAQRHVLVHEYGDLDYDKIWRVLTVHVPQLVIQLEPLVPPAPPDPEPTDPAV
ncbi:MAG: DUF86 domain-containing protein [Phycisphaerales bacterium JB039]